MKKGYITVFLALSLMVLLSLLLILVEGARISAIRMKYMCTNDIANNSLLGEYHRELFKQYDMLFVDMSYGGAYPKIENSEAHLREYLEKNMESEGGLFTKYIDFLDMNPGNSKITEYSISSDDDGAVLFRQISDYMRGYPEGFIASTVLGNLSVVQSSGMDSRDISSEREAYQQQIEAIGLPVQEVEEGKYEEVPLNNPADAANSNRSKGILRIAAPNPEELSDVAINKDNYISTRNAIKGTGLSDIAVQKTGLGNDISLLSYLYKKCGYYGAEKENGLLKYQLEYIVAGKEVDWENLEEVCKRIQIWREVTDLICILGDSEKVTEAEEVATALTAVILMPELMEPVKYSILYAWAYLESIQDMKRLLAGGRVPLIKTQDDWRTDIGGLSDVEGSTDSSGGGDGLKYDEYLAILLCMTGRNDKLYRLMDVMEMDIRLTPGNGYFRMDGCFDTFSSSTSVDSAFGYYYEMNKSYGYY